MWWACSVAWSAWSAWSARYAGCGGCVIVRRYGGERIIPISIFADSCNGLSGSR